MKRCLSLILAVLLLFSLSATALAEEVSYTDVPENAWYAEAAQALREVALMNGVGNHCFDPDGILNRAQLATVLYRIAGSPTVSGEDGFTDTESGAWYSDAVLWASQNGIVNGYGDGRFGTTDATTQEQMAVMLWRNAGSYVLGAEYADENGVENTASDWAVDAVRWARVDGLITDAVPYEPKAPANRAQAADMTYRYLQLLERFSEVDAVSGATPKAEEADAALDYSMTENWAYFEMGEDRDADVFLICPTVDTRSETNSFDLNDKLKGKFIYALDLEKGIYEEMGRLFSPYYRQMSINAYNLPETEREKAKQTAYGDVSAAFRWYLDHENDGRGIILAGFSQGGEMCLELLKEYYGGEGEEAVALRDRLIAVYSIGWSVTEEMTDAYPQIIPAAGETDVGTVISFDCEDGNVTETIIIPAGMKALSINPLNWKTDSTVADKSLNLGAVMQADADPIPALCGAYLGNRGELIVTDITAADYPPGLDIFPEGAYHLYDYMFFFTNLKENVEARTAAWFAEREADIVLSDDSSDFVLLSEAIPDAILEIRYYSTYNFVGDRIDGYEEPLALLTTEAAAALKEASDELVDMGYRLKIFDAYRPQMAVTHFMNWALDADDTRMKEYFYPELDKTVLFPQGYIAEHSGHSRGSTVDLTLFDMNTEKEVDMGGTFDYFGELSHPDYTQITEEQYAMRMLLREVMMKHGFRPLEEEWWHFTLEDEPYPNTYFTFPINSDSLEEAARGTSTKDTGGGYAGINVVSPDWVAELDAAKDAQQVFVVAALNSDATDAWISLHEKQSDGTWHMVMTTPGFIGKNGIGKTREGDAKTPTGVFHFNRAFGIADDPGCAIPYVKVDNDTYWSGDPREGYHYNELVSLKDLPGLDILSGDSEHIIDYIYHYQYCLNISYNEEGTPGLGSAIFLHCFAPAKPFTGGCVSIPEDYMKFVMQRVNVDTVVVIDTYEALSGGEAWPDSTWPQER